MTTTDTHPHFIGDKVSWDRDRLVVTSPKLLAKIDRPYLSHSTAKSMDSCPAQMVASRSVTEKFDLFAANNKGGAAHEVLETLYQLPPEQRNPERAMAILVEMANREPRAWNEVNYLRELGSDPVKYALWIAAVSRAYSGVFQIEDPKDVEVYKTEMRLDGVEVGGVPFKGFIDRVDIMPDGTFRVVDHKTGKDKSKPNLHFGDDHGDQGRTYKVAFEAATGLTVKHVYMYYIEHGKSRRVAISKADVRKTERSFAASWKALRSAVDKAEFVAKPGNLCGWCTLANSCPVAKEATNPNDPRAKAPSKVELGIPVLRPVTTSAPETFTGVVLDAPEPPPGYDEEHTSAGALGQVPPAPADLPAEVLDAAVEEFTHGQVSAAHMRREDTDTDLEGTNMTTRHEDKAWESVTLDGLNLNSYAAMGTIALVSLAAESLAKANQGVRPASLRALTGVLAEVVLNAQAAVTAGSRDWSEGANTRVRGALRAFLDLGVAPMPFGGTQEQWTAWSQRATGFCTAVVNTGIALFDGSLSADMSPLLAPAPAAEAA